MRDKGTERWGTYEPFHIMLNDYRIADIVITNHARSRYLDRISEEAADPGQISVWLWQCLKQKRMRAYSGSEQSAYLIDDDVVIIAEFTALEGERTVSGHPLYIMNVISFLGSLSKAPELRDLQQYYSWLRHSRRMQLARKNRKRR
ncbi:hypothetical protein [Paenibacillus sp. NPDC057934]|uniref:hypothetical protein n=1 Tax=Paenibacillus sp. NPDC057934 TaxID=3346282 RepID=UPI0036DC95FA